MHERILSSLASRLSTIQVLSPPHAAAKAATAGEQCPTCQDPVLLPHVVKVVTNHLAHLVDGHPRYIRAILWAKQQNHGIPGKRSEKAAVRDEVAVKL